MIEGKAHLGQEVRLMKDNQIPKEELLEKLTEIYDQLEELERALDTNLSEHRKKMINEQTAKMMDCNNLISKLENKFNGKISFFNRSRKTRMHSNVKLKLGF